jgi:hypothetical protein
MAIEIRETIVTPDPTGDVVQLHISDAELGDENGSFRLVLRAKLPPFEVPALAQLQREAMGAAQDALTPLLTNLARQITESGRGLNPRPRKS